MPEHKVKYKIVSLQVIGSRASSLLILHPKTGEAINVGRSLLSYESDKRVNRDFFAKAAAEEPMDLEIADWWVDKFNLGD